MIASRRAALASIAIFPPRLALPRGSRGLSAPQEVRSQSYSAMAAVKDDAGARCASAPSARSSAPPPAHHRAGARATCLRALHPARTPPSTRHQNLRLSRPSQHPNPQETRLPPRRVLWMRRTAPGTRPPPPPPGGPGRPLLSLWRTATQGATSGRTRLGSSTTVACTMKPATRGERLAAVGHGACAVLCCAANSVLRRRRATHCAAY